MSPSFVGSISDELDKRFTRDLTVQPVGYTEYGGGPGTDIARPLREQIAALPEAATVTPVRSVYMLHLPGSEEPGLLEAVDPRAWPKVDRSRIRRRDDGAGDGRPGTRRRRRRQGLCGRHRDRGRRARSR